MKTFLHISIKQRIYLAFSLLVVLFIVSAIVTSVTLDHQKKVSQHLSTVVDPSIQALEDFKKMILESKMYSVNWVFLRNNEEDRGKLRRLHYSDYFTLKERINSYASRWTVRECVDSLASACREFEELLKIEKGIMASLQKFSDYDDADTMLSAERKIEEEVLPRTERLLAIVNLINTRESSIKQEQISSLDRSSTRLRISMIILAITITGGGVFLSLYLARVIIAPVMRINYIVNNMGRGVIERIDYRANGDEIGTMVRSVNNLSENLQATARFAHEVGRRNFKAPFTPLSDDDTLGKALIAMRDNLRRGEVALDIKTKELERKNKELEQFAYVASHDLQEPLRTISSFVELFQRQYNHNLDENTGKYLNYIQQSSMRMKVLITDLLEYSRIGRNKELERVDCNKVLLLVLEDLNAAIWEAGADIRSDHLPVVTGYAMEIKQLFQNLVFNAIKFRKKDDIPRIQIKASRKSDHWLFSLSDNGIGIAEEHHDRIFIIFQRLHTRNEYAGSGIGLSHCKKIVELHKGRIWLESTLGGGTTFYFTIQHNIV